MTRKCGAEILLRSGLFICGLSLASVLDVRVTVAQSSVPKDDVWDFVVPKGDQPACDFEARKLPEGDLLLTYGARCVNYRPEEIKNTTFFGKKSVRSLKEAFGDRLVPAITAPEFKTKNGALIWTIGPRAHPTCYVALQGSLGVYEIGGPPQYSRKPAVQKRVLWAFDTPKRYTEPFARPCGHKVPFTAWAETIGDYIAPLDDGTFVLIDPENAVVVRFDQSLQTRSKLINRQLFLVDATEFDRVVRGSVDRARNDDSAEIQQAVRRYIQRLQRGDK